MRMCLRPLKYIADLLSKMTCDFKHITIKGKLSLSFGKSVERLITLKMKAVIMRGNVLDFGSNIG